MADLPPAEPSTAESQAAYRAELFPIGRRLRLAGLTFSILGILLLFEAQGWHSLVERTFGLAGMILIGLGWVLMIAGIIKRALYHKKRTRDLG